MGKIFSCQLYNRIYIHNVIHKSIKISDFEDEYENKLLTKQPLIVVMMMMVMKIGNIPKCLLCTALSKYIVLQVLTHLVL